MGILDGIVEWIAEQVMAGLDLVTTSVLGALGCDMAVFLRYFPAAETMYSVFVALAIGIILLNWVWQLFKNFGLTTDIQRYPDNYEVLSTDAALRAEKIACRLRHLIYSSTTIRKGDYLTSAGIVHGIEVVYEDGVLEVTLPGLLPKRKQRQNTEFLLDPFYFSLEQYAKEHPMPHFSDCVVCFTQVYDQCLPTRRIRDYDNLEEKQLLDVLSTFVMADDTGLLCDAYNTAALGEKDCTRISVMEKKRFPAWLAEHENTLKSISDF